MLLQSSLHKPKCSDTFVSKAYTVRNKELFNIKDIQPDHFILFLAHGDANILLHNNQAD